MFQAYYGGMSGAGSEGRDLIYYASIIDILQPYDWRKRGETAFKTGMASTDYVHASISAIPSRDYGLRFYNFLYKKTKQQYSVCEREKKREREVVLCVFMG